VNNSHLENVPPPAFSEILGNKVFHVCGLERMEIQYTVNRKIHKVVTHGLTGKAEGFSLS
jgi:hypothetical protein